MTSNHVTLTGRVSDAAAMRTLPSGDEIASFRLIVDRPPAALKRSKQRVDTFECTAWTKAMRTRLARLVAGDVVTVEGQLRRRFTRVTGGPASWVTVEVESCTKA